MGRASKLLVWVSALAALIAGVALAARQIEWPSSEFWEVNGDWLDPTILVLTIITLGYGAIREWFLVRRVERVEKDDLARDGAQALFLLVAGATKGKIAMEAIAVHVWKTRSRPSRQHPIMWEPELHRLASFKVHQRGTSSVRWTKGKGIVGRCWERQCDQWADLSMHQSAWAEGEWDALSEEDGLGMTAEEFERSAAYWAIYATPLKDKNDEIIGVVSVDSSQAGSYDDLYAATNGNVLVGASVRLIERATR